MVAVTMMPSVSKQNPFFPTCSQRLTATRQPQFWSCFSNNNNNNNNNKKSSKAFAKVSFLSENQRIQLIAPSFFPLPC
jgi:hypothetical protein